MRDDRNEGTRGRHAEGPTEMPALGWRDVLWRTFKEVSNDRVLLVAAGVTFYLLLALAPTLAAFVSVYGLFFDPATMESQLSALQGIVPGGAMDILRSQLEQVTGADSGAIGVAFLISLGLALWSANAGMKSLFEAMNVAYDETEDRGFFALTLVTMAMTLSLLGSVIVLIGANLAFGSLATVTGLDAIPSWILNTVTALVALCALVAFMAALYRFGPSRESPRWSWITPGAVIAGIGIVVVSVAFSYYVANFGTYNETYGSLGAVVGFLTWLWLTITVLILGAEINSELEHQTVHDTTTGPEQRMGARGAVMADEIGKGYGETEGHQGAVADRRGEAGREPRRGASGEVTLGALAFVAAAAGIRAMVRTPRR